MVDSYMLLLSACRKFANSSTRSSMRVTRPPDPVVATSLPVPIHYYAGHLSGRATSVSDPRSASSHMPKLIIKVPTEERDLVFETEDEQLSSVGLADLQNFVRQEIGGATLNRRLRFIYQGHVLTPTTNLARDVLGTQQQAFLLCTVGRILTPEEIDAEQAAVDADEHSDAAPAPQRGFDQLRDAGFAEEEIQLLRRNFGELYGATESNEIRTRTTAERLEQEEAWLSGTSAQSARYELVDEAIGLLIGAFAGIAVIFLLQMRLLNPVQQRMAVAGALLNLVLTAFRKFAS